MFTTNPFSKDSIYSRKLVMLYFVALILVGLFTFKDYGYTRDEAVNRWRGIVTANYIGQLWNLEFLKSTDPLGIETRNQFSQLSETEAEHGATFETVSAILEKILLSRSLPSEQSIYFLRHFLVYLSYLAGVYAIYCMASRRFLDWRIGLMAASVFILSPRIYGNAFFNSMDIVFLSSFALAANSSINLVLNPTVRNAFIAGIWVGLAIATRCLALVIPLVIFGIEGIRWLMREDSVKKIDFKVANNFFVYFIISVLSTYFFWPWLWEDPFTRIIQAFRVMSKIPFELEVLYFGKVISSFSLPWHYVPAWIGITTPIFYLFGFFIGLCLILRNIVVRKFHIFTDQNELQDLFFLGLFSGPLLSVMILGSPLYDSWRHLFFIYPFLILISVKGFVYLLQKYRSVKSFKTILVALLSCSLFINGHWILKAHPFESFYFNIMAGKDWKNNFDVDYWSLGIRPALEYIVRHDNRPVIRVGGLSSLTDLSGSRMLDPAERSRIVDAKSELTADYMVQIYRIDRRNLHDLASSYVLFHEIKIGDEIVLSIYKNQDSNISQPVALNEPISFSKQGKGSNYLVGVGIYERIGSSWHYPEVWGTWSATKEVSIVIPKPQQAANKLKLELIGSPQNNLDNQEINLFVNNQFNQRVLVQRNKSTMVTILLEKKSPSLNYVLVELKQEDHPKPNAHVAVNDDRWLGVGIIGAIYE